MKSAYYISPLGGIRMDYEQNTLFSLKLCADFDGIYEPSAFTDGVFRQIGEYLAGTRKEFDVCCRACGTEFQQTVWRALCAIPYGQTATYKEIAEAIGRPNAARAVGGACNKNPIWLIIPCHRVIGTDGTLTGYAGGIAVKEKLLAIEKSGIRQ